MSGLKRSRASRIFKTAVVVIQGTNSVASKHQIVIQTTSSGVSKRLWLDIICCGFVYVEIILHFITYAEDVSMTLG